jgi:hypothetical protein
MSDEMAARIERVKACAKTLREMRDIVAVQLPVMGREDKLHYVLVVNAVDNAIAVIEYAIGECDE